MIRAGRTGSDNPTEEDTMAPQKSNPKKEAGSSSGKQSRSSDKKQDRSDNQRDERKGRDNNR